MRMLSALSPVALVLIAGPSLLGDTPVQAPRPMNLHDLASWKRLGPVSLSPDGRWAAWRLSPAEGDGEVLLKATQGDASFTYATGSGDGALTFSEDGKWLAFAAFPTFKETQALKKQKKPAQPKVMLVDLATGKATTHDKVRRFAFAGERGGWITFTKASEAAAGPGPGGPSGPSAPSGPTPGPRAATWCCGNWPRAWS